MFLPRLGHDVNSLLDAIRIALTMLFHQIGLTGSKLPRVTGTARQLQLLAASRSGSLKDALLDTAAPLKDLELGFGHASDSV
jgi:hypothetical protein